MPWFYLFIAGIFEIVWAVGIKYCNEFRITVPLILVVIAMISSMVFLGLATRTIPMSIAYAVWTGIGIVGVFTYGVLILKDPISVSAIIFVIMILAGIIGLKLGMK
jgi:quaternary ammonium compound-resistance protein SugE